MDKKVTQSLQLAVTHIKEFKIKVANGESLVCRERYEHVSITVQGFTFCTTSYSLPLNGPDLVLGIRWLALLGPVECDWKNMTMKFQWEDKPYVIMASSIKSTRSDPIKAGI